jgi:hypothetical protein
MYGNMHGALTGGWRRKYASQDELWNPRVAAAQLLANMCRTHESSTRTILMYCSKSLENYARAEPEEQNHSLKEGVLYALGTLQSVVRSRPKFVPGVLKLLENHAMPEMQRSIANLRASACWVVSEYRREVARNPMLFEQALEMVRLHPPLPFPWRFHRLLSSARLTMLHICFLTGNHPYMCTMIYTFLSCKLLTRLQQPFQHMMMTEAQGSPFCLPGQGCTVSTAKTHCICV